MIWLLALFLLLILIGSVVIAGKKTPVLIYSDTSGDATVLSDPELMIRGKPDEIWKLSDGTFLIVEHKSGFCKSNQPYYSDQLQLAAYMHLVEKQYRPKKITGQIRYQNRYYTLYWNESLKQQLLQVVEIMRRVEQGEETEFPVNLSKCRQCEFYRVSCEKSS
ncbi:CRISPR-associated protein Cas4 [Lihuaxuella thermophila]|uniref:DUF83 domain-containing protein n=1 Tax=Lihuaxuella thermophila TaxID=1173111 RepID=A0A1H8E8N9_9BACL|nr:PD-(D/E)XK nuclease family protein [Lihuaxuella thermophila]SEN15227.1 protein of unknown function DUF83 [Lihuaxuella thermophila]